MVNLCLWLLRCMALMCSTGSVPGLFWTCRRRSALPGECTYAVLKSRLGWELLGCKGSGLCMGLVSGGKLLDMVLFSGFLFCMDSWACWGWRPIWLLVGLPFCGSGSAGLLGCRLLLSGCMSQLTLAPAAWIWQQFCAIWRWSGLSFLAGGWGYAWVLLRFWWVLLKFWWILHRYCWDSDGFLLNFSWVLHGFVEILMVFCWSSDGSCIGIVEILMGFCWSSDGFCIGIVEILMDFWWSSDVFCIGIVEILMGFCWSSDGFCIGIVEILIDFWWIYHVFCTVLLRSWWVMYGFCWKSDGVCMDLMKSLKVPAWICLVFWCDLHGFTWISGSVFW